MSLRQEYGYLRDFWREGFGRSVWLCAGGFAAMVLAGYGAALLLPAFREGIMQLIQQVMTTVTLNEAGTPTMLSLLCSNIFATFNACLLGLVPFVYLPVLSLGVNAAILGVLAAQYQSSGLSMGLYFTALLPHGIFELPALILALAAALRLCRDMTRLCRKRETQPFGHTVADCARVYALTVVPLLILASALEAYVTPWLVGLFFSH